MRDWMEGRLIINLYKVVQNEHMFEVHSSLVNMWKCKTSSHRASDCEFRTLCLEERYCDACCKIVYTGNR